MTLKYLSVKEEVQKHKVSVEHIRTNIIGADPLNEGYHPKCLLAMKNIWVL